MGTRASINKPLKGGENISFRFEVKQQMYIGKLEIIFRVLLRMKVKTR